ncbi:MAG: hypothetical protein PHX80_05420 [Candidatus Nanoarchaeia archaeon]|nr:hypothetical protein [Candidatus Nanoarchaeia archaeon]
MKKLIFILTLLLTGAFAWGQQSDVQYIINVRTGKFDAVRPLSTISKIVGDTGNSIRQYIDSKSGVSLIAKATIVLTPAQIANNTYVQIVPASGANKMIVPIYVDAVLNWLPGNTAYTADYFWLTFSYDGINSQLSASFPSGMNSILGITAKNIAFSFTIAELTGSSVATYPNAPLYIQNHNTVTSPGNSTLTVDVCYIIVDI